MHELSVCLSLLQQIERIAAERGAATVTRIELRIGPLSGIEPELLRHAWPLAATGTCAEAAKLVIDSADLVIRCTRCGVESIASPNRLLCSNCGDFRTRVISGEDMLLQRIELENISAGRNNPTREQHLTGNH